MRISYTPQQEELRRELRSYFATLMTPERREALSSVQGEYGVGNVYRETIAQMGRDGWLALGWPKEYGGQGRSAMDQLIFTDEAAIAGAPVPFLTINSVAPTIMAYGTDEQKRFFLPRIAAGDLHFSIGYSEPGAGTDLANLRTTAVRDGLHRRQGIATDAYPGGLAGGRRFPGKPGVPPASRHRRRHRGVLGRRSRASGGAYHRACAWRRRRRHRSSRTPVFPGRQADRVRVGRRHRSAPPNRP